MQHRHTNHLIHETSAYLLQHAHNPVDWYAWCDEALAKAKKEDKPVLVSIGYSACHWCHVMERESFEDEVIAEIMNNYFINIKIDREERPDLDHIYMDAVQTITGSGGWPLNVFLTPDLKPFYGGTYFPPVEAFNQSSWKQILNAVANAYKTKKPEIKLQASELTEHLSNSNAFNIDSSDKHVLNDEVLTIITQNLLKTSDKEWGGFGNAPKFPQTFSILYLLRQYYFFGDVAALNQACLSLDKMMMGGIYDQLGGGFARYSTDTKWQIPHFEKMLYDNALLIETYTEAFQLTQNSKYADVVKESIRFIQREFTAHEGGFYSALDADSEGEEGKYYVWSKVEIDALLGEDSEVFCFAFNISKTGNWDGTNILWMPETTQATLLKFDLSPEQLYELLEKSKAILFEERNKRIRPQLDAKIILNWNALMIKSLCKAYAALQDKSYLILCEQCIAFIEKNMQGEDNIYYHSWNISLNKQEAFLDDYAALIQAYIFLSQMKEEERYLLKAKQLTDKVIKNFSTEKNTLFYFTDGMQKDVIIRKKEIYDGATPSGNALIAENLLYLSLYFDDKLMSERAEKMLNSVKPLAQNHPTSFGYWALNMQSFIVGLKEIIVIGFNQSNLLKSVLKEYIPCKIIQSSLGENNFWPLLRNKYFNDRTFIYLCQSNTCFNPAATIKEFKYLINQNIFNKKNLQ